VPQEGALAGIRSCAIGPEGAPEALIWGDSHMRPLHAALSLAADEAAAPAVIVWNAGCPPFFGVSKVENTTNAAEDATCTQTNARLRAALDAGTLPDRLLLVGRWSYYAEGTGIGLDASNTITLTATEGAALTASTQSGIYAEAFGESLEALADGFSAIHVLRQPPEIPDYGSRVIAREMAHGRLRDASARASQDLAHAQERAARGEAPLRRAEASGLITYLDSWPYFCDENLCSAMPEGQALYFDNNHMTNSGGIRLRSLFAPVLTGDAP